MPWGEQTYLRFFPNLTWQSDPQIETVARMAAPGTRMLDLGAGGRRIAPDVIAVDFMPWRGTNLVADVQALCNRRCVLLDLQGKPLSFSRLSAIAGKSQGLLEHSQTEGFFFNTTRLSLAGPIEAGDER